MKYLFSGLVPAKTSVIKMHSEIQTQLNLIALYTFKIMNPNESIISQKSSIMEPQGRQRGS